ncbi:MAG TPA: hypothetical protein VNY30_15275 [Bryobacteraceae bacterium]|nr:hypothetical protein [Bryobacteraceae bacterium]
MSEADPADLYHLVTEEPQPLENTLLASENVVTESTEPGASRGLQPCQPHSSVCPKAFASKTGIVKPIRVPSAKIQTTNLLTG